MFICLSLYTLTKRSSLMELHQRMTEWMHNFKQIVCTTASISLSLCYNSSSSSSSSLIIALQIPDELMLLPSYLHHSWLPQGTIKVDKCRVDGMHEIPTDINSGPRVYMHVWRVNVGMNISPFFFFWFNDVFGVLVIFFMYVMECLWLVFAPQTKSLV